MILNQSTYKPEPDAEGIGEGTPIDPGCEISGFEEKSCAALKPMNIELS